MVFYTRCLPEYKKLFWQIFWDGYYSYNYKFFLRIDYFGLKLEIMVYPSVGRWDALLSEKGGIDEWRGPADESRWVRWRSKICSFSEFNYCVSFWRTGAGPEGCIIEALGATLFELLSFLEACFLQDVLFEASGLLYLNHQGLLDMHDWGWWGH